MKDYSVPLSKMLLYFQVAISGALILLACILATIFFTQAIEGKPTIQSVILIILWTFLPILWAGGTLIALHFWPKTTYILTNDALQVRKKGWFGAYGEELYRYETILTVSSDRAILAPFGTVKISLINLHPIVIHGVQDAEVQARKIKERVAKGQPKVQALPF